MFSYTLFLVLLLISPGLAVWAGFRIGDRNHLLSQAPEKPQSTFSLMVIVFGSLSAHLVMAALYVVQAKICEWTGKCFHVGFDPNVYRAILLNSKNLPAVSDAGLFWWMLAFLIPSLISGVSAYALSQMPKIRDFREKATLGWLKTIADQGVGPNSFILAYVVTNMEKAGAFVAYEGIVSNIALDDNRSIAMVVLTSCERFLIQIDGDRAKRIDADDQSAIPLIQLDAKNFKNVALEVFTVSRNQLPPSV